MAAVALNYRIDGAAHTPDAAETVVFAGSLGSDLSMWEPQVPALSPRYRVVRVDIRGHGASPVDGTPASIDDFVADFIAVIDKLEVERVHLVGLSLGGMIGMRLAMSHPHRLHSLSLLCTSARMAAGNWDERIATVRKHGTKQLADGLLTRWFTADFAQAHPETIQAFHDMIANTSDEGYAVACGAIAEMDLIDQLAQITAPTLVIAGRQDQSTTVEHLETIAAGIPQSRLEILDPAAHIASTEQADRVNDLLLAHFAAHPGR